MLEIQLFLVILIISITLCLTFVITHKIKEFKINDYLKLKLEQGRTNVYVKNRQFRQCMFLLLNIPVDRVRDYDMIDSIDEAAEKLDRSMERDHRVRSQITPEEEFMGHCSNIQAWADNEYDTRILHRNLAFPLLKRLTDVGDPIALRKFKEEIAMRYASGYPSVMQFLTHNGYLTYLNPDEFESMLDDIKLPIIDDLIKTLKPLMNDLQNPNNISRIQYVMNRLLRLFNFQHGYLLLSRVVKEIPENLRQTFVEILYNRFRHSKKFQMTEFIKKVVSNFEEIDFKYFTYEKRIVGIQINQNLRVNRKQIKLISDIEGLNKENSNLEELDLSINVISKIDGIENLSKLTNLKLNRNQIDEISGLEKLQNLKALDLSNNKITEIKGIEKLINLKKLTLKNNQISEINKLDNLINLEYLDLSGNSDISEIPEVLNELPSLKTLKLKGCNIRKYRDSTSKYFWMGQNYRCYSNFTIEDISQYEQTHTNRAIYGNTPYKHFLVWLLNTKSIMKDLSCNYRDLNNYEKSTNKSAIWSGKPTRPFLKWLYDQKQTRITSFN